MEWEAGREAGLLRACGPGWMLRASCLAFSCLESQRAGLGGHHLSS